MNNLIQCIHKGQLNEYLFRRMGWRKKIYFIETKQTLFNYRMTILKSLRNEIEKENITSAIVKTEDDEKQQEFNDLNDGLDSHRIVIILRNRQNNKYHEVEIKFNDAK